MIKDHIGYIRKHSSTALKHMSFRKAANIVVNQVELRAKRTNLHSRPLFIKVEPTPLCHMRCCHWHRSDQPSRFPPDAMLSIDQFVRIVEPISDTLLGISLSYRGDPLHNPALFDMIRYCGQRNIGTTLPTSFSYRYDDSALERLVDSGLDHIAVAVDGTTQEIYEQYRIGGNLDWVMGNCRRLVDIKRKRGSRSPIVEFKFIEFPHNGHQKEEARLLCASLGCDRFVVAQDWGTPMSDHEFEKLLAWSRKRRACCWPYRSMVVQWNGQVAPCCEGEHYNMGNVLDDGILAVWNNQQYQALRRVFSDGDSESVTNYCDGCPDFWGSYCSGNVRRGTAFIASQ